MAKAYKGRLILIGLLFFPISIKADSISNNFQEALVTKGETALNNLAGDLGGLLGGGSFHSGQTLGLFPIPGMDVGFHHVSVDIQGQNLILSDDDSWANAFWIQGDVGLPKKFNLILRGGQIFDGHTYGGGLKYGILTPKMLPKPSLAFSGLFNRMDHDFFYQDTISMNLIGSIKIPFLDPYVGLGYDISELKPKGRAFSGVSPSTSRNLTGKSDGLRMEAGINIVPFPFTYITAGIGSSQGNEMIHGALGVKTPF